MRINKSKTLLATGDRRSGRSPRSLMLLLAFLVAGTIGQAQTVIAPLWRDWGITLRDQLWNLSILSTHTNAFSATVEMTVTDAGNGSPLFSGISNQFVLAPGGNIVSAQKLLPVTYTLLSATYNFSPSTNTILPPGVFNICYRVLRPGGELPVFEGEGCFVLESDPLTPPSLIIPEENELVSTKRPFFTWLPPVPSNTLPLLNYAISVVEKNQDQSPLEAIQRNLPIFSQSRLLQNSTNYPANLPELDTAKTYAWQILAYNDNSYVGASECWSFRLRQDSVVSESEKGFFIPLSNSGNTQLVVASRMLRFSYNNELSDTLIVCHIRQQRQGTNENDIEHAISIVGGTNNMSIDLETLNGINDDTLYELYIVNARRERWSIAFKKKKI